MTTTSTCIIGLEHMGSVYIGGDSAGVDGQLHSVERTDSKVFLKEGMIFGFTDSFRMGQIIRYSFERPDHPEDESDIQYLCGRWIDSLITAFVARGYAKVENNAITGGQFLFGYNGKLYEVCEDFQIGTVKQEYYAVGCGRGFALGSMYTTTGVEDPIARLNLAFSAADEFSAGVRGPFTIGRLICGDVDDNSPLLDSLEEE